MTAQQLKDKYPVYPEILLRDIDSLSEEDRLNITGTGPFMANTIVRKKLDGKFYLKPLSLLAPTDIICREHINQRAKDYIELGKYVHPNSIMAQFYKDYQILDDIQD